ncbi:MAG: glycine betaine ABC transporter substrate-binding protein [Gordonia sp. (in: high G+C Gram-positive bacteria)]
MTIAKRILIGAAALVLCLTAVTACSGDEAAAPLKVGSSGSPDLRAAAAIYASALTRSGLPATVVDAPAGSDSTMLDDLGAGRIVLFPAFTGNLLTLLSTEPSATTGDELIADVNRSLPQGVAIGDPTGVSDRAQLLVASSVRERHGVSGITDCGKLPPGLPLVTVSGIDQATLGAFASCPHGLVERLATPEAVVDRVATGEALGVLRALQSAEVADLGDVQAIGAPDAVRAQDLVPVFSSGRLAKAQLKQLSRVAGELSTADLAELGRRVAAGEDPRAVAASWISAHGV